MSKTEQINLAIFCAALQGFTAGNGLYNLTADEAAQQAVEFARAAVRASYNNDGKRSEPLLS